MKLFILLITTLNLYSCAFKSSDDEQSSPIITQIEEITADLETFNLPQLKVNFLQNYKIDVKYAGPNGDEKNFNIDTKISHNDPDFEYRVGNLFIKDITMDNAANIGRFSTHTWGTIEKHDLSWVKYPNIDPKFFHQDAINKRAFLKNNIKSINIKLENSVKLIPNRDFRSIKNLELNFYYYNYETESYELLTTTKIERHFNAGVNETFEINIDNAPINLLADNYFKKGEFIISEVKDYEIPELNTTYKTLMDKIKKKSIKIVLNTPLNNESYYISYVKGKSRFVHLLQSIFDKTFTIEENKLIKINQFENNLPDFTYLSEIKEHEKLGKWYVFTNKLSKHYLDHEFDPEDTIVLSYITGKELANRKEEMIYSYNININGGESYNLYPLGNVSKNSRVDIQIKPHRRFGSYYSKKNEVVDVHEGQCGHNCWRPGLLCKWEINLENTYREILNFDRNLSGDISKLYLVVNDNSYKIADLIKESKVSVDWKKQSDNRYHLHLIIKDISKIDELSTASENVLFLKVETSYQTDFFGVKLTQVSRSWQGRDGCGLGTNIHAHALGTVISNSSIHMDLIRWTHTNVMIPEHRNAIKFSDDKTVYQKISISVSSTITNYFN